MRSSWRYGMMEKDLIHQPHFLGTWDCTLCVSVLRIWTGHLKSRVHRVLGRVSLYTSQAAYDHL